MRHPHSSISTACRSQQINRLVYPTQQKLTGTQCPIGDGYIWIELDRFLQRLDASLGLPEIQQRLTEMEIGGGIIGVEGNRRLELFLGVRQPGLHLTENPKRKTSR